MSAIAERPLVFIGLMLIMLVCLLIAIELITQTGSSGLIANFVASILFSVPFGSITNVVSQPTAVIPA